MIIDILGYRDWAREIFENVKSCLTREYLDVVRWKEDCDLISCANVFAIGWSEIIPDHQIRDRNIYVLHPSPLPRYRGGSPIQHQLLAGETVSAVTIFKLDLEHKEIDSGPIVWQMSYSLEGDLADIFKRIISTGTKGILDCINDIKTGELAYLEQNEKIATTYKRRKELESEIFPEELHMWPAWKLHAKIRGLQDPYPNAFITCSDGQRLYLTGSHLDV